MELIHGGVSIGLRFTEHRRRPSEKASRGHRVSTGPRRPATPTATSLIDGAVSTTSSPALGLTDTHMTNGVVSDAYGAADRTLMVTYVGGTEPSRITVPHDAPIVRYVSADRSAVIVGASVMIKANLGDQAGLVTVGKGVTPPM